MAKELTFTDPAFACSVTLSGTAKTLYEKAEPQFNRLKGLKTLGIVSHFSEIAMQTRHQHLVGLMRIFNKLCLQPKNKGLPKKFLWSFWCSLCFGQTGHAALSYDSEKAILLACHLDTTFREKFRIFLQPVIDFSEPCTVCEKQCEGKRGDTSTAKIWFEDLIGKNRWWAVHRWVAARKLIQEPTIMTILNQQQISDRNPMGFSKAESFKMLICPDCKWNKAIESLSRLDYVVRDITYAGTLGIHVDIDGLIELVEEERINWSLIKTLEDYLQDSLYEDLDTQTGSILYQRALADNLIKGKISIEMLFGRYPNSSYDDQSLFQLIKKSKAGKEVFDKNIRNAWKTWSIGVSIPKNQVPSEIERTIIKSKQSNHLSTHLNTRVTAFKMTQDNLLGLAICYQDSANRPAPKDIILFCQRILHQKYPHVDVEDINTALFEGLIAKECEHKILDAIIRLAELPFSTDLLKGTIDAIKSRASDRIAEKSISVRIGEIDYPITADSRQLVLNTLSLVISNKQNPQNQALKEYLQQGSMVVWAELLNWQSIYFGNKPSKKILDFVNHAQNLLAISVINNTPSAQKDLEIFALLESLKNPKSKISFRVSLPNLTLFNEEHITVNEYDVVTVLLKEEKNVEIWIWGVTTESNIERKRNEDHLKIEKLMNLLGNRWGNEVKLVENYLHKDGNDICYKIDGVIDRKTIVQ
jgi:hypothetical protein